MIDLLREYLDWFLLDTLLWTGALIALVLVLRRPVARHLGPSAAYSLWALPAVRLLLPPITLPAWMEPAPEMAAEAPFAPGAIADLDPAILTFSQASATPLPEPIDFATPLALLWLAGAVVFLARRFWLYGKLRSELLDDAVPVGEAGTIRLVETPAISGPLAFGVIDKVVALPVGFMTSRDRKLRDLAIAHELEHHRGHDLLANILVQPLFAVHWFNPLGWMGWTALRRDQEAACDARVVASRPRDERAAYAGVIADFARRPQVAPRLALAAPMACPVLGDKSIIQRLRNLSMTEISKRRRLAGRTGIAAALFALPMTASICYASASAAPEAPAAPAAPLPPEPPAPPEAPAAPGTVEMELELADLDRDLAEIDRDLAEVDREVTETRTEDGKVERRVVIRRKVDGEKSADGERHIERRIIRSDDTGMTLEERKEMQAEIREAMAEVRRTIGENGEMHREIRMAMAEAMEASAAARANAPQVKIACKDKENIVTSDTDKDGRATIFVCEANADRVALTAMKSARKAIEMDRNLSGEERAEALRALDAEIKRMSR